MRPLLLFDLVGTLVDEASDYESLDAAMDAARRRFRIADPAARLSGDFSLALMEILRSEAAADEEVPPGGPADFVPFEQAAKEVFAAVLEVRGLHVTDADRDWFWSTFVAIQRRTLRLHPDALPALRWARKQGHRVWVLTDADPYLIEEIIPHTDLQALVEGFVTASEAGAPKPHPAIFQTALARVGVAPGQAVVVGDSYERDILGARAAGIPGAVLLDRHRARTVEDVPVITSLEALPAALGRLAPSMN